MADESTRRSYQSNDSYQQGGQAPGASRRSSDPLAELARLIGQSDPYTDLGQNVPRRADGGPLDGSGHEDRRREGGRNAGSGHDGGGQDDIRHDGSRHDGSRHDGSMRQPPSGAFYQEGESLGARHDAMHADPPRSRG